MMIIDYATKDKVVQDSDGTRVTSYASGGFMIESAGLPDATGTSAGVSVTPVPGSCSLKCCQVALHDSSTHMLPATAAQLRQMAVI